MARCRELEISSYLTKPVSKTDLLHAVRVALGLEDVGHAAQHASGRALNDSAPSGLRILLAEDSQINQLLAVTLLEKQKHRVVVAADGEQVLEALGHSDFDLILMDVQMPKMDGLEATARIRRQEAQRGGHMPIIAMTANTMQGDRERCLQAGMDGYIPKPLQREQLHKTIEVVLGAAGVPDSTPRVEGKRGAAD